MDRERTQKSNPMLDRTLRTLLLAILLLLPVSAAQAQVENLVVINPIAPATAGGCYPGTAGVDATMFIRAYPGAQGCNLLNLNTDLCLARREFPGDGPNGIAVSFGDMAQLRPSVYGDGSVVFFVNNLDVCVMQTSSFQQEACYSIAPNPSVNSVAAQPQGQVLGLVPRDLFNSNVPANALQAFGIGPFPTLTGPVTYPFNVPLIFPETLDFMTRGAWIVFGASDTQAIGGQWGLYLVDRNTGALHLLAPPVSGYELRNPVFGQTSDDVIAFEAINTSTGGSTILTANLLTGAVRKIADISITTGIPTFNGDDTAILFNREDATAFSTVSLRQRTLLTDRITPFGPETLHIANAGYATVYRRGTFDDSAIPCPEPYMTLGIAVGVTALGMLTRRRQTSRFPRRAKPLDQ